MSTEPQTCGWRECGHAWCIASRRAFGSYLEAKLAKAEARIVELESYFNPSTSQYDFGARIANLEAKLNKAEYNLKRVNERSRRSKCVVSIGRCPKCDEFPSEWNSGGMNCSECDVALIANVTYDEDGCQIWTFDFEYEEDAIASERDYHGS